ncbi:MAG TPA: hypothetical protein VMW37_05060 [Dehalococcoidales bacterium]|nr:hypothetical protein [Dehalococcoidales bacterium]
METPNYIKSLVTPTTKQPQGRKVWSIDLQQVWLPFFTATNTMGDTAIPSDAIGCPLRLGYDKAGQVRFSQAGRPVIRVAKEISDNVKLVRDNFTANLLNYAGSVMRDNAEGYQAQIETARKAGEPVYQHDKNQLSNALKARAEAEAEAIAKCEAEAKAKVEAEAKAEAEAEAKSKGKRDLVHA